jgi:tetratricopeptide (TPR) repeat protein
MIPFDHSSLSPILQKALEASQHNDTDRALNLLAQASAEQPDSAIPQFLLGAELMSVGRVAEAEAAYANAVLLAPRFAIARFELGSLQFTSGRAALALVTWQPLMQQPDVDALQYFVRGYAALAQDAFAESIALFEQGIASNQENQPLNDNIRLLIDEVHRVAGALQSNPPVVSGGHVESDPSEKHFLLGAYGKHTSIH